MRVFTKLVPVLALLGTVTVIHADSAAPAAKPVSPSAMEAGAAKMQTQIQDDYRHVVHLKEATRERKDVIKLNCVNDRLVQLKAQMNIADVQALDLRAAMGREGSDTQTAFHDLSITAEGVHKLREEATACVGEPELIKQESGVEVHAPDIPDDPTTQNPFGTDVIVDVEPPGYASPFF